MNHNLTFTHIKQKNQKAFKKLFDNLYADLVNYANAYLVDQNASEDLVQEVFIYLWENAKEIRIHSSLKSYLFTMVRNRCINHLKKVKITDNALAIDTISSFTDYDVFESHTEEEQSLIQIKILEVVDALPEKMKQIVKLKFIYNYKYKEIANELNVSVNTVKTQLQRAKLKIAATLTLIIVLLTTIK